MSLPVLQLDENVNSLSLSGGKGKVILNCNILIYIILCRLFLTVSISLLHFFFLFCPYDLKLEVMWVQVLSLLFSIFYGKCSASTLTQ